MHFTFYVLIHGPAQNLKRHTLCITKPMDLHTDDAAVSTANTTKRVLVSLDICSFIVTVQYFNNSFSGQKKKG